MTHLPGRRFAVFRFPFPVSVEGLDRFLILPLSENGKRKTENGKRSVALVINFC